MNQQEFFVLIEQAISRKSTQSIDNDDKEPQIHSAFLAKKIAEVDNRHDDDQMYLDVFLQKISRGKEAIDFIDIALFYLEYEVSR